MQSTMLSRESAHTVLLPSFEDYIITPVNPLYGPIETPPTSVSSDLPQGPLTYRSTYLDRAADRAHNVSVLQLGMTYPGLALST